MLPRTRNAFPEPRAMKRSEVDAFRPYSTRALEGWIGKALPEDFFADFVRLWEEKQVDIFGAELAESLLERPPEIRVAKNEIVRTRRQHVALRGILPACGGLDVADGRAAGVGRLRHCDFCLLVSDWLRGSGNHGRCGCGYGRRNE